MYFNIFKNNICLDYKRFINTWEFLSREIRWNSFRDTAGSTSTIGIYVMDFYKF